MNALARWVVAAISLATGCGGEGAGPAPTASVSTGLSSAPVVAARPGPVRFIEGDIEGAREQARTANKLLVLDLSARWCEPCAVLRAEIERHPELALHEARFVFASVDVDRPEAAPILARYGAHTLPTILVLEPVTGAIRAMRGGSITAGELSAMLTRVTEERPGEGNLLASALAARAGGDERLAAEAYRRAARTGPVDARTEAWLAATELFADLGDHRACGEVAREGVDAKLEGSAPVMLLGLALRCAEMVPPSTSREEALGWVRTSVAALASAPPPGASAADRAELLAIRSRIQSLDDDPTGSSKSQEARLAVLEAAAREARTPSEAQALDHARASALIILDRKEEALDLLARRTKELPDRYEVWGRLGTTLLDLGRVSLAAAILRRASDLAYGAPRLVYLARLADALERTDRSAEAKVVLDDVVRGWEALPLSQQDARRLEAAKTQRAQLR